ncbi:hypothetical protein [Thiovibrio frasassiensis]|uniref:Uncharacterized protein n=1 Tax=Thiovibrio frasassiensis TaxID=2984131 RepID=A0A9X4RN74_9BACT|nr:hypothetical protein [Thiovibrio frasassiensis]MDG4476945.1 hypothetical protein [Thiovibrio frasassiensis]
MAEILPDDIKADLAEAAILHQRASSDYEKCVQFNKLMSELLGRLEDAHCYKTADKVMTILLDCNPKQGSQCEKASRIGDKMKKFERG